MHTVYGASRDQTSIFDRNKFQFYAVNPFNPSGCAFMVSPGGIIFHFDQTILKFLIQKKKRLFA